ADENNHSSKEDVYLTDDKLKLLEEMKQEGLITEEDYTNKKKELSGTMEAEPEPETSKSASTDDRAAELKELFDQELITEEDYKHKLEQITSVSTKKSFSDLASDEMKLNSMLSDSATENEKVKDLKELYDQGLITEDDYNFKLKELIGAVTTKSPSINVSSEKGTENDKLAELKEMMDEGIISEEDYEFKKAQLLGN
ncbi:MAG: SHOCT domain-containing protein, partial [Candidatus Brocadia sp.]|nr:SHOCT domain-containing protein [Candidatus Brocadia sp.]